MTRAIVTTPRVWGKRVAVSGARATNRPQKATPKSNDEVKAVRTSRALSTCRWTTAWPTPSWAKYWPKLRKTPTMATVPKALGATKRANTAVTPICATKVTTVEA